MTRLFLQAMTNVDRFEMVARIERALAESGGWVLDHRMYSNISIAIAFEVPRSNAPLLLPALQAAGLDVTGSGVAQLLGMPPTAASRSESDLAGFLQITFIHDQPDLRRDVPRVPG